MARFLHYWNVKVKKSNEYGQLVVSLSLRSLSDMMKCECGAEKANTPHIYWCDKFPTNEPCICCRENKAMKAPTPSMTQYHWDGKGVGPNRPLKLCECCSERYIEEMRAQWANYYSGLM